MGSQQHNLQARTVQTNQLVPSGGGIDVLAAEQDQTAQRAASRSSDGARPHTGDSGQGFPLDGCGASRDG
jgi:hypothetical protein